MNETPGQYSNWIRNDYGSNYGIPYFQPGYLYKDYAITEYLIEAFLTPDFRKAVNDYDNYFVENLKSILALYILLISTELNKSNINTRMNEQGLGQLKFIADTSGAIHQYGNVVLSDGAINTTNEVFDPLEKTAKFIGINTLIRGTGSDDISPYVRGFFEGSSSTSSSSSGNYVLSNREDRATGDDSSYNNSSIDILQIDLGIL